VGAAIAAASTIVRIGSPDDCGIVHVAIPVMFAPMEWTPENIKLLRILLGDTPQAFADRCGATQATVAAWETRNPSDPRFRKPGEKTTLLFDSLATTHGFTEEKRRTMKGE
jgi:hypothetical protein